MTAGIMTTANLAGRYMGRTGRYRLLPVLGLSAMALAAALLAQIGLTTSPWAFGAILVVLGLGMGCIFPSSPPPCRTPCRANNWAPRRRRG